MNIANRTPTLRNCIPVPEMGDYETTNLAVFRVLADQPVRDCRELLRQEEEWDESHPLSGWERDYYCCYYGGTSWSLQRDWWCHGLLVTAQDLGDFSIAELATLAGLSIPDAEDVVHRWALLGWV